MRGIGPRDRLNQLWQVTDNVSIRKGTHFIKAGVLVARRNWTFDESVNPRGSFSFDGTRHGRRRQSPRATTSSPHFLLGLATERAGQRGALRHPHEQLVAGILFPGRLEGHPAISP